MNQDQIVVQISLLIIVIGIPMSVVLFLSCRYYLEARASLTWPSVIGTIVSSFVNSHHDSDNGVMYRAKVTYSYIVDDKTYQATRVKIGIQKGFSGGVGAYSGAQRVVNKYPSGKEINVYYNPKIPENAVLEPGLSKTWWAALILSVVILGGFFPCFLLGIRGFYFIFFSGLSTAVIVGVLWFTYYLKEKESR